MLLGGGHANVHVLRMLAMEPDSEIHAVLVSRTAESPYSGMLPGHIAVSAEVLHLTRALFFFLIFGVLEL